MFVGAVTHDHVPISVFLWICLLLTGQTQMRFISNPAVPDVESYSEFVIYANYKIYQ